MERRVKNLVMDGMLDNFIRVLVYSILTIIVLKLVAEFIYPIDLKNDFAMGVFLIYTLFFLRRLYLRIDDHILKDLEKLETSIKKDYFEEDLDISEFEIIAKTLKVKNQQIKEKDTFIKTSLAAISHDMKTPLTVINTNLSLLRPVEDKNMARLDKIRGESEKISTYIDDLMEVSGGFIDEISLEQVEIKDFISKLQASVSLYEDLKEEKIPIINKLDLDESFMLNLDMKRFDKCLSQLLINAFEHKKAAVWLEIIKKDESLIISVADDGEGFNEEALVKGKNLFYTDNFGRTSGKGNGFGLFIADSYLKSMGADLRLENNKGARERIILALERQA